MVFVPPGSDHPAEVARADTPVAHDAAAVRRLAGSAPDAAELVARMSVCRACPRLVAWREGVADERRAAFRDEVYWGRPVPSWGPADAGVVIVGLAPAAHGGNRTGRIFTGDRSGDWLFAALHRVGLATQPTSVHAGDGQQLVATRVVAAVRCAPPANKPTPQERDTCRPWLERDLELVRRSVRAFVVLGSFGWQTLWPALAAAGYAVPARRPVFGHAVEVALDADGPVVIGCYHPSQQNTFTGKLTAEMTDAVLLRAARLAGVRA
jgi:uracil-DNA glycosylase family 4